MKAPGVLIISTNGRIVVNDLATSLCPNLKKLQEDVLIYIALVYDYVGSPYRLKAIEERKKLIRSLFPKDTLEKRVYAGHCRNRAQNGQNLICHGKKQNSI